MMKVTFDKRNLSTGIEQVMKAVPSKTTIPICECLHLEATGAAVKFTSNNMDMGIVTSVPGFVEEEGSIALEARALYDIVKKLPEDEVQMVVDDKGETTITCKTTKIIMPGQDASQFPAIPEISKEKAVEFTQFGFKELIRKILFAVSVNNTNKILTGAKLEVSGKELRITALDGFRISVQKAELEQEYPAYQAIVPGTALGELSKILSGEPEDTLKIYFMDDHIQFETDETSFTTRLIAGSYFKVENMMKYEKNSTIRVNRKELFGCIDRSTLFSKEKDKQPVVFKLENGTVNLSLKSQTGSLDETILVTQEGNDVKFGINPRYVIDALKAIDDDEVEIYITSPNAPIHIEKDSEYSHMILPIKFN